jgi:putative oligomerization/nucleic acid binding protein
MTVGKISGVCWAVFVVMSLAFLPLAAGILSLHALPVGPRVALAVVAVLVLWWGPFGYAMYLSMAVMRNGDRRLLRRGVAGTAQVLSVKRTNTVIQEGEFAWEAPRLYKYRLRVSVPGKAPYDTDCAICAAGISQGQVVHVAVSPHNKHRVTIDVGQASKGGDRRPRPVTGDAVAAGFSPAGSFAPAGGFSSGGDFSASGGFSSGAGRTQSEQERLKLLAQLGQLHNQGVLSDAEFAAQKAQILSN